MYNPKILKFLAGSTARLKFWYKNSTEAKKKIKLVSEKPAG